MSSTQMPLLPLNITNASPSQCIWRDLSLRISASELTFLTPALQLEFCFGGCIQGINLDSTTNGLCLGFGTGLEGPQF